VIHNGPPLVGWAGTKPVARLFLIPSQIGKKLQFQRLCSYLPLFVVDHHGARIITSARCKELAHHYKALSSKSDISEGRAFMLRNIARSFTGLAGQLERLDALARDEEKQRSRPARAGARGCNATATPDS
jgi:hypothetical protein